MTAPLRHQAGWQSQGGANTRQDLGQQLEAGEAAFICQHQAAAGKQLMLPKPKA